MLVIVYVGGSGKKTKLQINKFYFRNFEALAAGLEKMRLVKRRAVQMPCEGVVGSSGCQPDFAGENEFEFLPLLYWLGLGCFKGDDSGSGHR
jgi:hypothetical protein